MLKNMSSLHQEIKWWIYIYLYIFRKSIIFLTPKPNKPETLEKLDSQNLHKKEANRLIKYKP